MSELLEDEILESGDSNIGSINHSITQVRIASLLNSDERFTVMTELSLDINQQDFSQYGIKAKDEIKPDICLYPNTIDWQDIDIPKMIEMPLLAIEILSPSQSLEILKNKVYAYFSLGVKSCWLAIPSIEAIDIYSQPKQHRTFTMNDTEVVDELLEIHLPIQKVFRKRSNEVHMV
ncbi:Uma2 family endonuclease [Candidatus Parabeggiatoa sp. HSG14]|uniref:Uma2 family endonuclease n=1 Tax=Candidatus Parabeggiatoa sp. HSG14 TaxID=3055593 RepID=UPI0025A75ABE|nr:Uma2 family endonuclease [Thiotrichales bacterium HSG14]